MSLMTVFNLFVPAPATPQQVSATNPGTSWLTKLMQVCVRLGLQVTDWNSGGVARTIMTAYSWMMSTEDALVSGMAQGGFLDYAATGTVSYVDPTDGVTVIVVPVTVDPSVVPGAGPGWLDILADSTYDCQRIQAAGGAGVEVITNTSSSSNSFAAGGYHVTNPANGLTYSNVADITIGAASIAGTSITGVSNTSPAIVTTATAHGLSTDDYVYVTGVSTSTPGAQPNGTWQVVVISATAFIIAGSFASGVYGAGGLVYLGQGVEFEADVEGPGTSVAGSINQAVTVLPGVVVSNPQGFVGTAAESNVALANRCRLKLAALSPNGAKAAYEYFALTAYQALNAEGTLQLVTQPITRVVVLPNIVTGVVEVVMANSSGAVGGVVDLPVTGASNANPLVITTAAPHTLASGNVATISGVEGNTGADGTFVVTVLSPTSFSIPVDGTSTGTYIDGGIVEGGDLGEIDAYIQTQCVPDAVTEQTVSATPVTITVSGTIYVAAAYAAQASEAVQTALTNYQATFPIGGQTLPASGLYPGGTNIAPFNEILGIAENALPAIDEIANFLLNGDDVDVSVGTLGIVSFPVFNFTVIGV
jgi:hypothetical protein